ncbi:MAG TPA: hypothetical protein VGP72_17350 [Planctomycetota bacterium]|jgi:hypothetical protein
MHRIVVAAILALVPLLCVSAEVQPADEVTVKEAQLLAEVGDLKGALPLLFRVLRQGPSEEVRSDAREHLQELGLTAQEIFQLDPATLKPEDAEKLYARLVSAHAQRKRDELDLEYARDLLHAAIAPRATSAGEIQVDVQPKDVAKALELLLNLALSDKGHESSRKAQKTLEEMGIAGPKVDLVRKEIVEGKLSPQFQDEMVCAACLHRLEKYREWVDEQDQDAEHLLRRRVAQRAGGALFKFLQKQYAQSPQFKQAAPQLSIWVEQTAPRRVDEKF